MRRTLITAMLLAVVGAASAQGVPARKRTGCNGSLSSKKALQTDLEDGGVEGLAPR